ncbi:hypothetical protein AT730_26250 (plasmid) [Vibrio alginolyticus]|nr:hypothetical protein AT730_26250 [Vibrio alginolyticus]
MKTKDESQFKDWFSRVVQKDLNDLKRAATRMEKDGSAIRATTSTEWNNCIFERHISRLKMLKNKCMAEQYLNYYVNV